MIFVNLSFFLVRSLKPFALSSDKFDVEMSTGKYFWRSSFLAYLTPALQVSANLIHKTLSYSKLKFSVDKLRKIR